MKHSNARKKLSEEEKESISQAIIKYKDELEQESIEDIESFQEVLNIVTSDESQSHQGE